MSKLIRAVVVFIFVAVGFTSPTLAALGQVEDAPDCLQSLNIAPEMDTSGEVWYAFPSSVNCVYAILDREVNVLEKSQSNFSLDSSSSLEAFVEGPADLLSAKSSMLMDNPDIVVANTEVWRGNPSHLRIDAELAGGLPGRHSHF